MKVILIADLSANGKVLLAENPQHPVPPEAIGFYVQKTIETGNLILGKKAFDVFEQFLGGVKTNFPNVEIVLLSTTETTIADFKVVSNPEEALQYLTAKGFNEIVVGGGTNTYNSFLNKDLVTDIYFNIVPIITGVGGVLGTNNELTTTFKLAGHKLLGEENIQIHLTKA